MLRRLRQAVATLRPRTLALQASRIARLSSQYDELARLVRQQGRTATAEAGRLQRSSDRHQDALATLRADLGARVAQLEAQVAALQASVADSHLRAEQLTLATSRLASDGDLEPLLAEALVAGDVRAHVEAVLARTPLEMDPYPHMVLDDLLPASLYRALITTLPPRVLFEGGAGRQIGKVPPRNAGRATFRVWRFLVKDVVEQFLQDALIERFREPLIGYARRFWPSADLGDLQLNGSDGRIIYRRRGYVIPPHRDPKWAWLTFIFYLAKPGDPDTWGTQLYHVSDDVEAPGAQPFWMKTHHHVLARDVRFVPNRALVFLNADGSHGASIPEDAPEDFERYIYQLRIGPEGTAIERLKAALSPEARQRWEGKEGY